MSRQVILAPTWLFQCSRYAPNIQVPRPPLFQYTLRHEKYSPFDPSQALFLQYIEFTYPNDCCHESTLDIKLVKHNHCECDYLFFQVDGRAHTHKMSSSQAFENICVSPLNTPASSSHLSFMPSLKVDVVSLSTYLLLPDIKTHVESLHPNLQRSCNLNTTNNQFFLSIDRVGKWTWCHLLLHVLMLTSTYQKPKATTL